MDIVFITCRSYNFYPRPPRGGRRHRPQAKNVALIISIHALREEGDPLLQKDEKGTGIYFYPRPPRGGRQGVHFYKDDYQFISIHALREEGDALSCRHVPFP